MWTPCPVGLDSTAKILGLEFEDLCLVFVTPFLLARWLDTLETYAAGAALGVALYFLKRGKPPGTVVHRLHGGQWLIKLPGVLSPRPQTYSPH